MCITFLFIFGRMKKALTLFTIVLFTLQLQAQDQTIIERIQAEGTAITTFEGHVLKELRKKDTLLIQNGSMHYIAPDKVAALFEDDNYMIINGNRMSIDIGIFHGRFKLSRNKLMRSISLIFLYGIQGRCNDFIEESNYDMEISNEDGFYIIQFNAKKKHFLGLGYRCIIFKYDENDLRIREIVLIDYNNYIDTFTISNQTYGITINEDTFEQ